MFYGLAVGVGLGVFYFVDRFDIWTCHDPYEKAVNEPEINPSETRLGRATRPPERREFALYRVPSRSEERAARVVAVPGDSIEINLKGEVSIDDKKPPEEAKAHLQEGCDVPKVLVPRDCVFVLCEQRSRPGCAYNDSRSVGPIDYWAITDAFPCVDVNTGVKRKE
jgi:hypothetical protein